MTRRVLVAFMLVGSMSVIYLALGPVRGMLKQQKRPKNVGIAARGAAKWQEVVKYNRNGYNKPKSTVKLLSSETKKPRRFDTRKKSEMAARNNVIGHTNLKAINPYYGRMPKWLNKCSAFYLDLGCGDGKSIIKLFMGNEMGRSAVLDQLETYRKSLKMKKRNFLAKHLCTLGFDPNPEVFKNLRQLEGNYTSKGYKVKIFPFAVTRSNRRISLFKMANGNPIKPWGPSIFKSQNSELKYRSYEAKGVHLADFILQVLKSKPIVAMRMDIAGSEYRILKDLLAEKLMCQKTIQLISLKFNEPPTYNLLFNENNSSLAIKMQVEGQNDCKATLIKQFKDYKSSEIPTPPIINGNAGKNESFSWNGEKKNKTPGIDGRKNIPEKEMFKGGKQIGLNQRRNYTSNGRMKMQEQRKTLSGGKKKEWAVRNERLRESDFGQMKKNERRNIYRKEGMNRNAGKGTGQMEKNEGRTDTSAGRIKRNKKKKKRRNDKLDGQIKRNDKAPERMKMKGEGDLKKDIRSD